VSKGKSASGRTYTFVDVVGTYQRPIGPPVRRESKPTPGWRVINVWIDEGAGAFVLKLAGPKKSVDAHAAALRKCFGAAAADAETRREIEK
jgi:hypothetical protein